MVWLDERYNTTGEGEPTTDVYLQRLSADGQLSGGNVRVSGSPLSAYRWSPKVEHNPARNEYVIVWAAYNIFGQRVTASGDLVGPKVRISAKKSLAYYSVDWTTTPRFGYVITSHDS